jgi:thioredoxin-dependent peroxiredoxin
MASMMRNSRLQECSMTQAQIARQPMAPQHRVLAWHGLACLITLWLAFCPPSSASTPALGSTAPAFKLQDQAGKWHELKTYRGKWVVLYFYPKDQTPGCTTQACEFRDNVFAFREANAVVLGISVDDVESHRKFAEKHGLPFPLLADASKDTARSYGVLKSFIGGLELARRETFLIDPQGRIVKRYTNVEPEGHSVQVLNDIKELQKNKER